MKDTLRVLECDCQDELYFDSRVNNFADQGIFLDYTFNIDGAVEHMGKNKYYAVIFHFDVDCSREIRQRYREKVEWLRVFQHPRFRNPMGELDVNLIPGGGIFMVYLHSEGYKGKKILTTGVDREVVQSFLDARLIDHHTLRGIDSRASELAKLILGEKLFLG